MIPVPRTRRHRSTPVLIAFVIASLGVHSGALALYDRFKPQPLPRVILAFTGQGGGVVESSPHGLTCFDNCANRFEPGTRVRLVATVTEESTFEGWNGACIPRSDWILECEIEVEQTDVRVEVKFGRIPERVELAWVTPSEDEEEEKVAIALPDPEIEAELLMEPLEELTPETPEPPPELAKLELPKPPPPAPAVEAPPPPPPPKMEEMPNMTSVEVPDENEVETAPDDATHLSDKNRNVAEETHATQTNLERAQAGEATVSEESNITSEEIGAKEDEIAQLDDEEPTTLDEGDLEEAKDTGDGEQVVGMVSGENGERGEDGDEGDDRPAPTPGVLAMRGVTGRGSIVDQDKVGDGGKRGKLGRRGTPGIRTQLAFEDYERIVGKDKLEEELALGRTKKKSKRRGRFERKMGAVKAALENFTPSVKPGNQTALKTRAAPFAVYIARMHRSIHELWGFGFLDDLDRKAADHPLNNRSLHTKLEIVVNPDGTIHKTTIVKHSGMLEFDVAAIDAIITGEPYGDTPAAIRSPDGRAYIHWGFYRNNRQCGTFNANPFILSEAPDGDSAIDDSQLVRNVPLKKRLQKLDAKAAENKSATSMASVPSPENKEADHAANRWVTGFVYNRPAKMAEVSGTPFRSGDMVVANTRQEIASLYKTVLQETRGKLSDWKLFTAGGYRKKFGALPPGIQAGKPQLLMVVRAGKQQLTLELTRQKSGTFLITGLHR